jgi:hypothetical protein
MDGSGYTALVDHPNGAAHLGAWYAIVEICSRQRIRGNIPNVGGTCRCLGRISRLPADLFTEVIPRLIEIGWIECYQQDTEIPPLSASTSAENGKSSALQGREQNRMEGTERNGNALAVVSWSSMRFAEWWAAYPLKQGENLCAGLWTSLVTVENEAAVFACMARYLASDHVARGVVKAPNNWLHDCSRDNWASDWPAAANSKPMSTADRVIARVQQRIANGERPL